MLSDDDAYDAIFFDWSSTTVVLRLISARKKEARKAELTFWESKGTYRAFCLGELGGSISIHCWAKYTPTTRPERWSMLHGLINTDWSVFYPIVFHWEWGDYDCGQWGTLSKNLVNFWLIVQIMTRFFKNSDTPPVSGNCWRVVGILATAGEKR